MKSFDVPLEVLQEVAQRLTEAFQKGLEDEEKAIVKMFITYVHSLPDGTEEGDFLALDLGGSNFRVLQLSLQKGGKMKEEPKVEKMAISKEKKEGTQEELFDFIVESIAAFLKKYKIDRKLPLGFTFSFPVVQTSLTAGTLKKWTKDFKATGAEGRDVVELLHDAIARRHSNDVNIDIVAVLNDTTGTQLAVGYEDPNCHVGLILGTGTNACYMEKTAAILKYKGDRSKHPEVIINTEWGAFGDDGKLSEWLTEYDAEVEKKVHNPQNQTFEKLISGKYLGAITHAALLKLTRDKVLFGGKCSEKFGQLELDRFESKFLSDIEGENGVAKCKEIFKKDFQMDVSDQDCELVRQVCEAVSTRAARLAGAGIVALVKKIGKIDSCTVAVDGSLYKDHPKFSQRMQDAMNELAPGNGIVMKLSTDGSGKGAAVVAAVACRLK